MKVIIKKDYEEVSHEAAEMVKSQITQKENSVLGLATGSTPIRMYEKLIGFNLDWSKIKTFNLDEYVGLEGTHKESYRYFMNEQLFNKVNIDKQNTFVPLGVGDLNNVAIEYDEMIKSASGIDLQILGIGENAHIGFNEPGSLREGKTSTVDLTPSTIQANARMFDSEDDVPKKAISMGIGTILMAKKIILMASGEKKADAIKHMIENPPTIDVPASFLQEHHDVTIIIDEAAASKLTVEK